MEAEIGQRRTIAGQHGDLALVEDRGRPAILEHRRRPLRRVGRLNRHVRRACLEDAEEARHHALAALRPDRDACLQTDAAPKQSAATPLDRASISP